MSHDGKFICYILEDVDRFLSNDMSPDFIRTHKVQGKTAIPTGTYEIAITFSNKFKKPLPILLGVVGFEGIRIHAGNKSIHTDGCLLTGTDYEQDEVINSRVAFLTVASAIEIAIQTEKVFIEIIREGIE